LIRDFSWSVSVALTQIGQIIMRRRAAGIDFGVEGYFTAQIVPGKIEKEFSRTKNDD